MPAENMQNESFSPDEPFGCHPPWQTPINPKSLAKLDGLLASDWELPPELFSLPPITDRYWAEHVLAALARHGRLDQADKLRVELRQQGMSHLPVQQPRLIRSLHHLACTGGTLISKVIASLPSVALLSEVNPLNRNSEVLFMSC